MPKASPARNWRAAAWSNEPTIADDARIEILNWVGREPTDDGADEVMTRVTSVLGDYSASVHLFDEAPRPANQIAALDEIVKFADPLRKSLRALDSKTAHALRGVTVDARKVGRDVGQLAAYARVLRARIAAEGSESRGGKRKVALRETIRGLETIYQDCSEDPSEEDLLYFVRDCLAARGKSPSL